MIHRRFRSFHLTAWIAGMAFVLLAGGAAAAAMDGERATELTANCGSEANCKCAVALNNLVEGLPYSAGDIEDNKGPDDPLAMFNGGGSENIATQCRIARYFVNHDPAWLERYFDLQLSLNQVPFLGNEAFSSVYTTQVVGSAIAALQHARARNHAPLVAKASRFLRTYWTIGALAAIDRTLTRNAGYNRNGDPVIENATANNTGFNLGLVGMRAYVNGIGANPASVPGDGLQGVLLSTALEHPARKFTWGLNDSPGFYGGWRAALLTAGYTLNAQGKLSVALNSRSVPAAIFGLTDAERSNLSSFISTNGTSGLATVTGYLSGIRLKCDFTVIRTTGGVLTWWGTSAARVPVCASGKGGTWAVSEILHADGTAAFLSRTTDNYGQANRGEVWRDGASVCNVTPGTGQLPQRCFQIPLGTFRHELKLGVGGGLQCVAGCPGGPPGPQPCPYERAQGQQEQGGGQELQPCFPPAPPL
jgi:hypothetical protein